MTVAVAVSGGRDSLLALALLRHAGQTPLAIHAFLAQATPDRILATLYENCRFLGVELLITDLREQFEKQVIKPYIRAYLGGLTPNPCVWCNAWIKFGVLLDVARSRGARILATGHYARLEQGRIGPELWRGADQDKDQSYFLALLTLDQLGHAAFPLAMQWKKDATHRLEEFGLTPALPEESQEVCFIPGDYRDFIAARARLGTRPGPIVLPDGVRVGTHQGLWNYTIGQRRGLDIAWSEPLYVLAKEQRDNRLVVAPRHGLRGGTCFLEQENLLVPMQYWPDDLYVQTRYRQQPMAIGPAARVLARWPRLELPASIEPPASGQLAVFYSGQGRVLAGAVIGGGEGEKDGQL
ncbi:MAG TPA: tRNA 2-thiouridine(34) synthase MnmA [Desulfonatronum sp.]|nr:tRNA 2-thiouridine(34) synthase MnmA [Desulfonatronum sp.]